MLKRDTYERKRKISINEAMNSRGCPLMLMGNNRNWICLLCGQTGTGKSYSALHLAERLDPTFNVNKIVFSVQEFLQLFTQCRAGDMIIFDEGEEFNSRRGMKEGNVQMGIILSMLRFTQISVIFTLPSLRMIDINARRLAHAYLYTIEVDRRNQKDWRCNKSGVFWYNIYPVRLASADQDLLYVHPIAKNGMKWSKLWLNAPSQDLLEAYELRKREVFYRTLSEAQNKLGMSTASAESAALADESRNLRNRVEPETLSEVLIDDSENIVSSIMRD